MHNGDILAIANILHSIMLSAAEAEVGALFVNANEGKIIGTTLDEMGGDRKHPPLL